ncbi:hypothetical protein [Streptomyces sp. NPDC056387]|uniref:hypothetical protein n=1 Tax=Streptomyces sp. NPDC056387 TaxID=3345803 RepID=UPI0035DD420D
MTHRTQLNQAEEHLRRARAQAQGDAHAILDKVADRYRRVRHASPMTKGNREARICTVSVELFGYGPRAEAAEREALRLAPPVDPRLPITRGEYAVKLHTVLSGRSL